MAAIASNTDHGNSLDHSNINSNINPSNTIIAYKYNPIAAHAIGFLIANLKIAKM